VYGQVGCLLQNGRDIAEELEEHVETSGAGVSKTKTSRSIASIGPVVDVVLEESLASVVFGSVSVNAISLVEVVMHTGEAFAQFHNCDQVG
jgi:hypothetical protein